MFGSPMVLQTLTTYKLSLFGQQSSSTFARDFIMREIRMCGRLRAARLEPPSLPVLRTPTSTPRLEMWVFNAGEGKAGVAVGLIVSLEVSCLGAVPTMPSERWPPELASKSRNTSTVQYGVLRKLSHYYAQLPQASGASLSKAHVSIFPGS